MLNFKTFLNPELFFFLTANCILNFVIINLWKKNIHLNLGVKKYNAIQRIHKNEISRLGGFTLFICFFLYMQNYNVKIISEFFGFIFLSFIPALLMSLMEDMSFSVRPTIRLISLIFTASILIGLNKYTLPSLSNIFILSKLMLYPNLLFLFYVIAITSIANAMNLLDGANGLCASVAISVLICLLLICFKTQDYFFIEMILNFVIFIILFLLFNYPLGSIFLGDLGAYFFGILISIFTIILYGRHPEISPWCAILSLIYPITEMVFSFFRRLFSQRKLHKPDLEHLHYKIFLILRKKYSQNLSNNLVFPSLLFFIAYSPIALVLAGNNILFILVAIGIFIFFYTSLYLAIDRYIKGNII
jgi:UDP-N-acetylmuramyl pentapeptide phosphotransferase/UDP-N-acetylglucosamine-1-phosphate transferase